MLLESVLTEEADGLRRALFARTDHVTNKNGLQECSSVFAIDPTCKRNFAGDDKGMGCKYLICPMWDTSNREAS